MKIKFSKHINLASILLLLVFSSNSFSQNQSSKIERAERKYGSNSQGAKERISNIVGSGESKAEMPDGNSTYQSANTAHAESGKGNQMSTVFGLALGAYGAYKISSTSGFSAEGWLAVGMGLLQLQQADDYADLNDKLGDWKQNFDGSDEEGLAGGVPGLDNFEGLSAAEAESLNTEREKFRDSLAKNPNVKKLDIKNETITTKDGKTYKFSDFASPAAMAAAGFSSGDIAAAMGFAKKKEAEIVKKFASSELGLEGGGAGAGRLGAASGSDGSAGGIGFTAPNYGNLPADYREPANMAGLQKDYNGEPIGVSADSLFLMMKRRYDVKKKQDAFFDETTAAKNK
ncbi:MAG: hypothetical protein ACLGGX_11550 [Bdellovibrionia bacterium]